MKHRPINYKTIGENQKKPLLDRQGDLSWGVILILCAFACGIIWS